MMRGRSARLAAAAVVRNAHKISVVVRQSIAPIWSQLGLVEPPAG
jgi:hypothetical protein